MRATRVLMAIEPRMYGEALAFYLSKHRPWAEVSLPDPPEDVGAEVGRAGPGPLLVVANRVPPAAKGRPSGSGSPGRTEACLWALR